MWVFVKVMHQQSTETETLCLTPEASIGLLLASAQDAKRRSSCVAMHSLHAETGFFNPRGRLPLPPIGSNVPAVPAASGARPQVISLPHQRFCRDVDVTCHVPENGKKAAWSRDTDYFVTLGWGLRYALPHCHAVCGAGKKP